jgi:hypothetical protein
VRFRWACILFAVVAILLSKSMLPGQAPQDSDRFVAGGLPDQLLQHPDVQEALKLTPQQVKRINEIRRAVHEKHQKELDKLRDLDPQERRRGQAVLDRAVSQEIMQAVGRVLQAEQSKRLEQIHRQQQGLRAFSDPTVDKALRLTDDQRENIKKIGEDAAREARMLFRTVAQSGFPETLKKLEKMRRKAIEQAVALLTDEQRKVWQGLLGEPFEVKSAPALIRQP